MIAILDYEAGNLTSVDLAVRHVGGEPVVTQNPEIVAAAERVIFPGVGSAAACMSNLRRLGLDGALRAAVAAGKPTLAICIGLQLLFDRSAEDGGVDCLGLLPGTVERFAFADGPRVKIPHMGWNEVSLVGAHPLLSPWPAGGECYYVHSYYAVPADESLIRATCEYGGQRFVCAAGRDNLLATQFHPEKSGEVGLGILRHFLAWDGSPA